VVGRLAAMELKRNLAAGLACALLGLMAAAPAAARNPGASAHSYM
jgi:hypothetical protein